MFARKYVLNPVAHTIAPSMDICVSSNFERFLFFVCGNDTQQLKRWMEGFNGRIIIRVSYSQILSRKERAHSRKENFDESAERNGFS